MNRINLTNLQLKTFTEQAALDYCQINNLNPDDIIIIYLNNNELTDISGIKLFKNLKDLHIDSNELTVISSIKFLDNLGFLSLNNNKITDISVLINLKNLEILGIGKNYLKDISPVQYLKNLIVLGIENLKLESYQIEYIMNIKKIFYQNAFKDMKIIKKLKNL